MKSHSKHWLYFGIVVMLIAALAFAWEVTPLSEYANPDYIRSLIKKVRNTPWAIPLAILIYTICTLALLPRVAMTTVIVLTFAPLSAFSICMIGSLVSGSIGYLIGNLFGLHSMEALIGNTAKKISDYVNKGGIIGITLLRMLPIAPYTIVNITLAMLKVPYLTFLLATFLGILPGTAIASLLGFSIMEVWDNPTPENIILIGGGFAGWLLIVASSHIASHWWQKHRAAGAIG